MNRHARWGVLVMALFVLGLAVASNASGGDDSPPVSVLSLNATGSGPVTPAVASTTTSTAPPTEARPVADFDEPELSVLPLTATTPPPTTTTSTTRPRSTTSTLPPTTTTTTTTTTIPPTTTTTVPPTTTTTTVPPTTTTTTIPPVLGTVHIHNLKGDDKGDDDEPYAKIEVLVRNDRNRNQRGVLVIGQFSAGDPQQVSGTTNNRGKVTFESGIVDSDTVTFTVLDLILEDYAYVPEDNQKGPSVTVELD